ncbi:MAG TPA: glycosyltransferase [Thermomicrobiales bacterium]|nr:glycosyltransferase [Thermomicrobiales bacterium]
MSWFTTTPRSHVPMTTIGQHAAIERVAMLSVHTSPVATLGSKDAGGMNVHVRELAYELGREGVEVDLFTRRSDPVTPEVVQIADRVRVVTIDAGPPEPMTKDDVFCVLPEFATQCALYSLRAGTRYDIVHSHYWLSGWASHLLQRYWNAPTVHTFHTLARLKNAVYQNGVAESDVRSQVERRLLDVIDYVIAPNPDERAEMVWRMGGVNSRICIIPPGVDLTRFHPGDAHHARARLDLPANPLVLFVGRIDPMKGIDTLLDAFASLRAEPWPDLPPKLIFIGGTLIDGRPDPDLSAVIHRAEVLGIRDDVLFRGSAPQEILPDYYAAATVAAVPSRYESFGLVAVEAMACGLPVVASRAGGLKFTVEDGRSGILVPSEQPRMFASAMSRVIRDPGLRSSLQVGARQAAIRFSWHAVGPAMLNLYERLSEGERENLCCPGEVSDAS